MNEQQDNNSQSLDSMIESLERDAFIGRQKEMEAFKQFLSMENRYTKVLHIYGPGGIGKSFLLGEFNRVAVLKGALFLHMDSDDFAPNPTSFLEKVLQLLNSKMADLNISLDQNSQRIHQYCMDVLSDVSEKHPIIIAIDTYENMDNLDRWFRQVFVRHLHTNVLIVLAGRKPLKGEWEQSPAWRTVTKQMKLSNFDLEQTRVFLMLSHIKQEASIRTLWQFTGGHPLTLALASLTSQEMDFTNPSHDAEKLSQVLIQLTQVWLKEVVEEAMLQLIEVAALFNRFDQSSLAAILNEKVSADRFHQLTSISFVKQVHDGWTMHDLIKNAVRIELQHRNPDRYQLLTDRLIKHYYKRTIATRSMDDISQFFYHIGDEAIQSAFFQETVDLSLYLEPIAHYNFHEVTSFFQHKRDHVTENRAHFFDRGTNKSVLFHVSEEHNRRESEMMNESYIKTMGYDTAKLLKNKHGETLGICVIVPVNSDTLPKLMKELVSRKYFASLTESEKQYWDVPEREKAGYFIRLLDYTKQADTKARSFLLYHLFYLLLSGGKIIASTPLPFFQNLLGRFGFTEVPGAIHHDYGKDTPSPTYLLDVSGPNLAAYLGHFMKSVSQNNQMNFIAETFSLTPREIEIVALILENCSNASIAKQLFIAEVTVKKHVTRILAKADVTNRAQLIKRIMELI